MLYREKSFIKELTILQYDLNNKMIMQENTFITRRIIMTCISSQQRIKKGISKNLIVICSIISVECHKARFRQVLTWLLAVCFTLNISQPFA